MGLPFTCKLMIMDCRALSLEFLDNCVIKVTYQNGVIKTLDMETLIPKYPVFAGLRNRELFLKGQLDPSGLGIIWNDQIDIAIEGVYDLGETVGIIKLPIRYNVGLQIKEIREQKGMRQTELSKKTNVDQGDISKIEDGQKNITLSTLERLADGLDCEVEIVLKKKKLDKVQRQ